MGSKPLHFAVGSQAGFGAALNPLVQLLRVKRKHVLIEAVESGAFPLVEFVVR